MAGSSQLPTVMFISIAGAIKVLIITGNNIIKVTQISEGIKILF